MADIIAGAETATAIGETADLLSQILPIFSKPDPSRSGLLTKLEKKADNMEILSPLETSELEIRKDVLVQSPILDCLLDLYLNHVAEASYVLYAPPSMGKTTAARTFIKYTLQQYDDEKKPRALMVSGPVVEDAYFKHITHVLQSGETAWFEPLCVALKRNPKRKSSILIFDDFDQRGLGDCNIKFMKHFCKELYARQDADPEFSFFVVILTQHKDVADELCRINNWKKIAPMPGAYVAPPPLPPEETELPNPKWTGMPWKRDRMVQLVQRHFQGEEFTEEELAKIVDNMNPIEVIRSFKQLLHQKRAQGSPSRTAFAIP